MNNIVNPSQIFKVNSLNHSFERPTLLLEKRNGDLIGKLIYENLSFNLVGKGVSDFQITVHKINDNNVCEFWDQIKDLQIINWLGFRRFVVDIDINESTETVKHINCVSLEGDELSQAVIRNLHVNDKDAMTTLDPDNMYSPTYLYVSGDPKHSLLDRVLNAKTKHWRVGYVDDYFNVNGRVYKACNLQREFTIDGQTPYDVLEGAISQECGCTFVYDTYDRLVNCYNTDECVFDTQTMKVLNDVFYDLDTKTFYKYQNGSKVYVTGSYQYLKGIGQDTTILLTKERLSEDVTVNSDKDSIKNCFYVTGGDDVITNYVASSNATGNNYIYKFAYQYELMSDGLVQKIKDYQDFYKQKEVEFNRIGGVYVYDENAYYDEGSNCYREYDSRSESRKSDPIIIDDNVRIVNNQICVLSPYSYYENGICYDEDGNTITKTHEYEEPGLFIKYCQATDRLAYWEHNKFPNMTVTDTTATEQLQIIEDYFSSNPLIITNACSENSFSHVTLLLSNMCGVLVDNRYKATAEKDGSSCTQINDSTNTGTWTGKITVVRETDEDDYDEATVTITVKKSQDAQQDKDYCDQKIKIALAKMDVSDLPLTYNMTTEDNDDDLRNLFSQYNLTSLKSFRESFGSCINVLDDLKNQMLSTDDNRQNILSSAFDKAYSIYENRRKICVEYSGDVANETTSDKTYVGITEAKVIKWQATVDDLGKQVAEFQKQLSIEAFLGDDYAEFLSFIREDEYNNGNYTSDGLSDSEILYRANELKEVATAELEKASNIHYTIDGTINNIFNIKELETIKDNFNLFNYVRYIVDGRIYKLRLLQIQGDENSFDKINVTFGDVVSVVDMPGQEENDKLEAISSMSTTYDATTLQARQGSSAFTSVDRMKNEGLNSAEYIIRNSNAEIIHDDHGSIYKNMNDNSVFSNNQLRITPAGIYLTDDGWRTTGMAVGTVIVTDPDTGLKNKKFGLIADYVYGTLMAGEGLTIANSEGSVEITGSGIKMNKGTITWGDSAGQGGVNTPTIGNIDGLSTKLIDLSDDIEQLDGRIQTFTQSTLPSISWNTTEEKDSHINDLWLNTATSVFTVDGITYSPGETYVYKKNGNTYSWEVTHDATLKALANSKAMIYTSKPITKNETGYLYRKGDLWIINNANGVTVNGVLYKDKTVLTAIADNITTTFNDADWIPATTKYATDLASDSKITPTEKLQLKYTKMNIDSEYSELSTQASKYTVSHTEYTTAYNSLATYLNGILSNMDSTTDVVPDTYSVYFSTYYEKRDALATILETARTNYADNVLSTWVTDTFSPYQQSIARQIDGKIDTFYQSAKPHDEHKNVSDNDDYNVWIGDLWYNTTDKKSYMYIKKQNGSKYDYVWEESDGVPDIVFDQIDGKNTIFTVIPNTVLSDGYCYHENDIWYLDVKGTNSNNYPLYEIGTILVTTQDSTTYNKSHWIKKDRYTDDTALDTFKTEYNTYKSDIQSQLDGKAETWYSSTDPSTSWDGVDKKKVHVGDLWYETGTQKTYVYESGGTYKPNDGYGWTFMNVPTDVFDKIDGKSTIYVTYPSDPEIGDLFIPTVDTTISGKEYQKDRIYRYCSTGFEPMDYTGDAELLAWIDSDYSDMLNTINGQIDGKARSWYQNTDPSLTWSTDEDHEGDLWYNTSANSQVTSIYKNGAWLATNVPKAVFDEIDGVATIYVTYPESPDLGDLLIPNTDITSGGITYKAKKVYRYNGTSFIEVDYTDDSALTNFLDNTYVTDLSNIGTKIDAKADTWYKTESEMSSIVSSWNTTTIKDMHISDIWYCTAVNQNSSYMVDHTYMYSSSYTWEEINGVPQSVFDEIDGKKTIYLSAPITDSDGDGYLYHAGDMWVISSTDQSNSNTNTNSRNLAKQYSVKTMLISSVDRQSTFTASDWTPSTTESAEKALSDISDMCNDGKLTGVEKIQTKRRLDEIDDEKAIYEAKKNAYSTNTSVTTAWNTYLNNYNALKTQSSNWSLNSTSTTDITASSFTNYFTSYYTAKESLDSALEAASKKYAEDQAANVQNNLTSFKSKVQGALMGDTGTEIGNDYIISPKIGGGYLYLANSSNTDKRSVTIDPLENKSSNSNIFQITNRSGNATIYADSDGNANFVGDITATSLTISPNAPVSGMKIISSVSYAYANSDTATQPADNQFSPTINPTKGKYLWTRTTTSYQGGNYSDDRSYTCNYIGIDGTTTVQFDLIVSAAAVSKSISGEYSPSSIILTAKSTNGTNAPIDYNGRFKIETTNYGTIWTTVYTSSSDESSVTYTVPSGIKIIRCSLYAAGGTTTLLDEQTIPIVEDGAKGADGKDAYTTILSNESHTFAGNESSAIPGSTTTSVIGYKGATQVATTVGTISGLPTGMSATIIYNGTTSTYISIAVISSMTTRSGTLTIPVTVDGKTFNKVFSYALSLKGIDGTNGANGTNGSDGISITEMRLMYGVSDSSTTQPTQFYASRPSNITSSQFVWTRCDYKYLNSSSWINGTPQYDPIVTAECKSALVVETNSTGLTIHPLNNSTDYMKLVDDSLDFAINSKVKAHFGTDGIWLGGSTSASASSSNYAFKVDSSGNGYFSGRLLAATGTFSGTISAASGQFTKSFEVKVPLMTGWEERIKSYDNGFEIGTFVTNDDPDSADHENFIKLLTNEAWIFSSKATIDARTDIYLRPNRGGNGGQVNVYGDMLCTGKFSISDDYYINDLSSNGSPVGMYTNGVFNVGGTGITGFTFCAMGNSFVCGDLYVRNESVNSNTIVNITSSSEARLNVVSSNRTGRVVMTPSNGGRFGLYVEGTDGGWIIRNDKNSNPDTVFFDKNINCQQCISARVTSTPNCYIDGAGTFHKTSGSAKRFKEDFSIDLSSDLDPSNLYDIPVYSYKYKKEYMSNEDDIRYHKDVIGILADDVLEKYPIAAEYHYDENGNKIADDWSDRYIVPAMLKLIQNQKKEIDELKDLIKNLIK